LAPAIVLVVAAVGSDVASAQSMTPSGVEWQCVQQNDEFFHVLCMPKPTGDGGVVPSEPGGIISVSRPGRGDMRAVGERGLAEVFSAKAWRVPLYVQPSDELKVSRLLQSVLCDTAPYCSVRYRIN
jgi:hypothetical protein